MPKRVIIAGGGSGGHVFPAIAIGQALRKIEPDIDLLYVGAKGKLEEEKVPQAGFDLEVIPIRGINRKSLKSNLSFPFALIKSVVRSYSILKRFRPDAAVGVGGYASWPILRLAVARRIPTLIQEQNFFPGLVNRDLAKAVDRICVAYEGISQFPKSKTVLTGNPVRSVFYTEDNEKRVNEKQKVLILGGSLGALSLNESMRSSFELIRQKSEVGIVWQMGARYAEEFGRSDTAKLEHVEAVAFLDDVAKHMKEADVIVTRAGAIALSELAIMGKAAIIVPSPNVAEDHQTKNAMALVKKEACTMIKDSESKVNLVPTIYDLLNDKEKISDLEVNIAAMAVPHAELGVAREILDLIKE